MTTTRGRDEHLAPVTVLPGTITAVRAGDVENARVERVMIERLARRRLSTREVSRALHEESIETERIPAWLSRYEELGYVDDDVLAHDIVALCRARKGLGRVAIEHELRRRDIPDAIVCAVLNEISGDDESTAADAIAAKRLVQLSSNDDDVARRRLTAFLLRKGYSAETTRNAVRTAFLSRDS